MNIAYRTDDWTDDSSYAAYQTDNRAVALEAILDDGFDWNSHLAHLEETA